MKIYYLLLYSLFLFTKLQAQDILALISAADKMELMMDENGALNKFKEILKIQPTLI